MVLWLGLSFLCGGASVAWAQNAFPLSSLIDPEVALYIEIAHPDQQWDAWEQSELARRYKQSGLESLLAKSEFARQWRKVDESVAQATPLTLTDHIRGLCGEGLSLAVFVPNQGPPQGMWVSRARSAAALESTLKAWDRLEPPLKTERRGTGKNEFFARRIRKGDNEQVLYYARRDDVLILSDHEPLVAGCVQRLAEITAGREARALSSPARGFLVEAEQVVPEASTAAAWVYGNPRAWDRWLDREFDHTPGAQLARNAWLSLRGLGASLRLDDGVTLTVRATLDGSRPRPGWTAAVDARDPSDPLRRPDQLSVVSAAPADAVAVVGGSIRPSWWLQQLHALQSDREKEDWQRMQRILRGAVGGFDPWKEVGAALLRDWGAFVTNRSATTGEFRLTDWNIVTLHQLTAGPDQRPDLVAAIDDSLGLAMQLFAAQVNGNGGGETVTPTRIREGVIIGRKFSGRLDCDIGYEIAGNRLWAGRPFTDIRHHIALPNALAGSATELAQCSAREFPHPALMAWINVQELRKLLPQDAAPSETAEARLPKMLAHLIDRGFAAVSVAPDRVELKVGGRFAPAR